MEACSSVLIARGSPIKNLKEAAATYRALLDFHALFGNDHPVELEVGCGNGGFIFEQAKRHPMCNFIAVELCSNVILTAMERILREGVPNVRFLNIPAEILPCFLPEGSISALYLNFSTPLPGSTHARQRLTSPRFLDIYSRLLCDGGKIYQKTDCGWFFDESLENYAACGFRVEEVTRDLHHSAYAQENIVTEYEATFLAQGKPIYRCVAVKLPSVQGNGGPVAKKRCSFSFGAKEDKVSEKMLRYHDTRWCKPEHRDGELFAMLVLEGMQAGVSWNLILEKEENFRRAFDGFDPATVAAYGEEKIEALMQEKGIIRNRKKIEAAIGNARAFCKIQEEFGSFDAFIWSFTEGKTVDHHLADIREMPAKDALSERVSAVLRARGFKFVGPTIVYSYLQGIGVINDHWKQCDFR